MDQAGRWIRGFVKVTYAASSLAAELLGIREDLLLCHHGEIHNCVIFNDNLMAANILNLHANHWCTITPLRSSYKSLRT